MTYWPLPNTQAPDTTRRERRVFNITLVARYAAWRVRHHRQGTPALYVPEPWSPDRW